MRILATGQVENHEYIVKQLREQSVKPDDIIFHLDKHPARSITKRRQRIAENHEHVQRIVRAYKPDLVWQLEQDTVLHPNTLENLLVMYEHLDSDKLGYVSAVQVGRHGLYSLGAWVNFTPNSFESLDYTLTGTQPVEATGLYCLLAKADVWLKGKCEWAGQPWGPDVNFGLSLKALGFDIFVNMDIPVGHQVRRNDLIRGEIWPSHASTCNVKFIREPGNEWKYETTD